ncbi:MAG: chloride channel protein [Acidobacteriota bacterium]
MSTPPAPPGAERLNLKAVGRWFIYGGLVGIVAGLGAVLFHALCLWAVHILLSGLAGFTPTSPAGEGELFSVLSVPLRPWLLVLIPAIGGLLSGLIVYTYAPEAAGHGTDSAIEAFHQHHGIIRTRIPAIKVIASVLTIGSGGSGGREGPIAQIGAGFGSFLGRRLKLPERDRRILLAAGVGAGVGSIFRAPLAGALFAAEILYSEPESESDAVIPAAISTIAAYCVFSLVFGFDTLFATPPFAFRSPLELVPYTVLAVVVALAAGGFVKVFYGTHALFEKLAIPNVFKPMIGGGLTGLLAVSLYLIVGKREILDVLAFGYGSLQQALMGRLGIVVLLVLAAGKLLTTSLSIGSGGSGGVFGPSMVIGGSLGGVIGMGAHQLAPVLVPDPGAFVVVGMAGFFAAAANTPISTLVMVSEMTGTYQLLLPALWVCTLSYLLGRPWKLYRSQVPTRMDSPAHRSEFFVDLLEGETVGSLCPAGAAITLPESASLQEVIDAFAESNQEIFPVVDHENHLTGLISLRQIRKILDEREAGDLLIARDIATDPASVLWSDPVDVVLQKFVSMDVNELPVTRESDHGPVVSMISRRELIDVYNQRRLERLRRRLETA